MRALSSFDDLASMHWYRYFTRRAASNYLRNVDTGYKQFEVLHDWRCIRRITLHGRRAVPLTLLRSILAIENSKLGEDTHLQTAVTTSTYKRI